MPIVNTSTGAGLHYEDTAPGRPGIPVILIHGLVGTARGQLGDVMDWLAEEGRRAIGLTLRGYGQSTPKPRDFPLDFYWRDADDVLAFMDALEITQAHILGYSDGGEVALLAACKQPGRFASVMTVGAVGSFGPELRPAVQRSYPGDWITAEERAEHGIEDANAFTRAWVRSLTRIIDSGGDVSLSQAHRITCPLLLMLGRSDTLNPPAYGQKYVDRTPAGRLALFDCGHGIHSETPDEFRRVVGAFLQEVDPRP